MLLTSLEKNLTYYDLDICIISRIACSSSQIQCINISPSDNYSLFWSRPIKDRDHRPERFSGGERTWIKVNKIRDCDLYSDYAPVKSTSTVICRLISGNSRKEFAWVPKNMTMSRPDGFIRWVINNMQVRLKRRSHHRERIGFVNWCEVGANQVNALALVSTVVRTSLREYPRVPFSSQVRNKGVFLQRLTCVISFSFFRASDSFR